MKKAFIYTIGLLFIVSSFFLGMKWQKKTLGNLPKYKLLEPVDLSLAYSEEMGGLPKDTTIYEYGPSGDTTTYILFFNLKNQMIIQPFDSEKNNLIDPLTGFTKE